MVVVIARSSVSVVGAGAEGERAQSASIVRRVSTLAPSTIACA
jgi:hypothetical protein